MKIGIVGAGNIGSTAAKLFVDAGHEIAISNSRGPETLRGLVGKLGSHAHASTVEEAAKFGDVVLISIPFGKYKELAPRPFAGKIVIDSNNYYPERDGKFPDLDQGKATSSELLAAHLPGARIVKAFNTIWFEHLRTQVDRSAPVENRRAIFVAGNDSEAKGIVSKLIEESGFAPVDTGSLREGGRAQQPNSPIYNKTITAREARSVLKKKE